ncbi:hypothetical protein Hdeb2414_s0021g00574511 [Helianthus debilis subsp. tardiflorus]
MANQEQSSTTNVDQAFDCSAPMEEQVNLTDIVHDDDDFSVNDPFLNLLCYDKNDEDEVDLSSVEDWSGNEQDYDKDGEDEDSEDEDVVYPCYNPNMDWKLVKPVLAMKFESPAHLKDMLIDYGVANGYQLVFTVNDYNRLLVKCGKEETEDDGKGGKRKCGSVHLGFGPLGLQARIVFK